MDTQKLRQHILDLAIRGKLVPQDPNDEPASVLLDRIRAEKERLIAEGKIKRPKAKKSTDKSHYQQFTPPFDIPDSWVWVRLEEIIRVKSGENLNVRELQSKDTYPVYGGNGINGHYNKCNVAKDTIIIGRVGFYCGSIHKTNSESWVTDNALIVDTDIVNIDINWLCLVLIWANLRKTSNSTAQPVVSGKSIYPVWVPLPSKDEQSRIVDTFDTFIKIIETIEISKTSVQKLISLTKTKILDLAMQGKLVPQDPADEPAADMLLRINPKAKIITDNPHYPQLPDNWVLARIKDLFEINPKNKASDDIQAGFVPMASIHDGYSDKFHYDVKQWGEIKSGFTHFADGDIAVAKISPCLENRKSMILRDLPNGIGAGTTELLIFRSTILIPEFSLLFFKSNNFIKCCTGTFNGVVGQQRVGKSIVEDIHIPIPPLNIQRTIVQRVQEWFNCLDNIIVSLSN